ncbi:MAG: flagellar biosynthesis protein [Acidobacteria bacterium]|nr:flagellar biosynthesis protein [Acidobacteriota bacterium]
MNSPIQNTNVQDLLTGRAQQTRRPADQTGKGPDFQSVLSDRLKLSAHAKTRLESREIALDADAWERVMDGVDRAAAKGSREALVMVDDVALIVSVKNRTVITAVDQTRLKENVFTNIDSAVIV